MILGLGHDVVDLNGFREQLEAPGTQFVSQAFTAGEQRAAQDGASDTAAHLGARWAAKEAFIKAWSSMRYGLPPVLGHNPWSDIEVVSDRFGRPKMVLHGPIAEHVNDSGVRRIFVSMSHDGPIASATVILEG